MQEIKKIQKTIEAYEEQIRLKINSNPTQAKILMHKKRNLEMALKVSLGLQRERKII